MELAYAIFLVAIAATTLAAFIVAFLIIRDLIVQSKENPDRPRRREEKDTQDSTPGSTI